MTGALTGVLLAGAAPPETGSERPLASVEASGPAACPLVTIHFNGPIRYSGTSPAGAGETRLLVEPAAGARWLPRDQLGPPPHAGPLSAIHYLGDAAGGPALALTFSRATQVEVALGNDAASLNVKLVGNAAGCADGPLTAPTLPPLEPAALAAQQAAAEDAIARGDRAEARRIVDDILARNRADAPSRVLELDGMLARLDGDDDHARASFEAALARTSDQQDKARLDFRLANLKPAGAGRGAGSRGAGAAEPGTWRTRLYGSASAFYSSDHSINRFTNIRRPAPNLEVDERVNVEQLLATLDVTLAATNGRVRVTARGAGSHTYDTRPVTLVGASRSHGDDRSRVYDLSLGIEDLKTGLSAVIGRQTMFRNGIAGRFDGAALSVKVARDWRVEAEAGFPQYSPRADLVERHQRFVGAALRHHRDGRPLDIGAYVLGQWDKGYADRLSVGLDGRYTATRFSLYGLVDYDLRFSRLARIYGLFVLPTDKASWLTLEAHHFYDPPLALHNAVLGQPDPALGAVADALGRDALKRLALDRTSLVDSLGVGYSRALARDWRLTLDATWLHAGPRRASAGVRASPAETQVWLGAQLTGNNLLMAGDTVFAGVQWAETPRFRVWTGTLGARLPLARRLAVEPRLEYRHRSDRFGDGYQSDWRPNIRGTWQLRPNLAIDGEIGRNLFRQRLDDAAFEGTARERATIYNVGVRMTF